MRTFIINPGSTSTKIAVYEDMTCLWSDTIRHAPKELAGYPTAIDQYPLRMRAIRERLQASDMPIRFDAVMARGGLLKPLEGGVYIVNENMMYDLIHAEKDHACNLGALLADEIARECACQAYIADPVVVDEMVDVARYTGMPGIRRRSIFHALNSKAVSHIYAHSIGKRYEELNLVVAHIGGGISISAHRRGRVVDVNNALDGDGPFATERSGGIAASDIVDLCFSGDYTKSEIKRMIHGGGGMMAYLGTNDMQMICLKAEQGEEPYKSLIEAMLYSIAKYIGSMYVALGGKADAIILTGGIAQSGHCMQMLKEMISCLGPAVVMPGENEIVSLAYNALCVFKGSIRPRQYV